MELAEELQSIRVKGSQCIMERGEVNPGTFLILWNNDKEKDLWIDRFDVRGSLDYREFKRTETCKPISKWEEIDDSDLYDELMFERFQDLLDANEEDLVKDPVDSTEDTQDEDEDQQANFGFRYNYQNETYKSDRVEIWVRPTRQV